jgi:hypothetical protein
MAGHPARRETLNNSAFPYVRQRTDWPVISGY